MDFKAARGISGSFEDIRLMEKDYTMGKEKIKPLRSAREKRTEKIAFCFLLPNLLGFLMFTLFPAIAVFVLAVMDWDGFGTPEFVGLKNFINLFNDQTFRISFVNNLIYTVSYVPLTILLGLLIALGLNREFKGLGIFRCIYFLPHITAMVAVAMVWRVLYNPSAGVFNNALRALGVENPPAWISSSDWALFSIILMASWKSCGYYMVMLLAGLKGIPAQLYEAAQLDGATSWQQFIHITRPMLTPTIFMVTILAVISSFKVFDAINIMTQGGPGRSTNVIVFNIYREGFQNLRFGYASAMAVILFIMILVVTLVQFRGEKRWVSYT